MALLVYDIEKKKLSSRIKSLNNDKKLCNEEVLLLESDFKDSVSNMDDEKSVELEGEIKVLNERIESISKRKSILESESNSNLVNSANETVRSFSEIELNHVKEADKLLSELDVIKNKYLDKCLEIKESNYVHEKDRSIARRAMDHADFKVLGNVLRSKVQGYFDLTNLSELGITIEDIRLKVNGSGVK